VNPDEHTDADGEAVEEVFEESVGDEDDSDGLIEVEELALVLPGACEDVCEERVDDDEGDNDGLIEVEDLTLVLARACEDVVASVEDAELDLFVVEIIVEDCAHDPVVLLCTA